MTWHSVLLIFLSHLAVYIYTKPYMVLFLSPSRITLKFFFTYLQQGLFYIPGYMFISSFHWNVTTSILKNTQIITLVLFPFPFFPDAAKQLCSLSSSSDYVLVPSLNNAVPFSVSSFVFLPFPDIALEFCFFTETLSGFFLVSYSFLQDVFQSWLVCFVPMFRHCTLVLFLFVETRKKANNKLAILDPGVDRVYWCCSFHKYKRALVFFFFRNRWSTRP